jgi:Tol biopolymer transport system component
MHNQRKNLKYILGILIMSVWIFSTHAQGIQTEFGKSRVQYGKFDWYFYRTSDFEVYYYMGGKNLAQYVLTHASEQLEEIEELLNTRNSSRITIVIYNTYADYLQSNITLQDEQYNSGGHTPIVDNIAFVYFDGDHVAFDKRIKSSLLEVLMNEALYGTSIQERIQNVALLNIPEWYYKGLISYLSGDLSLERKERFEDGIEYDAYEKFGRLKPEEKILIGHYFWEYVVNIYGKSSLGNILYLTRINKNIESGFDFVIGKPFYQIYQEWYKFYRYEILSKESSKYQSFDYQLELENFKKKGQITQIKLSPDANRIAYVLNKQAKTSIWIYDLNTNKRVRILKKGHKVFDIEIDKSYPLIEWHPRNNKLAVIYEEKTKPVFFEYDFEQKKKVNERSIDKINKVLDFSYSKRGSRLVLSAIRNGNSDIFMYELRSFRLFPITNDIYDDLYPVFVDEDKGIVFSSNRIGEDIARRLYDPELNFNPSYDLFYYDAENKSKKLRRISYTTNVDEIKPAEYDTNFLSYLTNENNIINRNAVYLDSVFFNIEVIIRYTDTARYTHDTLRFWENDLEKVKAHSYTFKDSLITSVDTYIVYHDTAYHFSLTNYIRNIRHYNIQQQSSSILEYFEENENILLSLSPIPLDIKSEIIEKVASKSMKEKYQDQAKKEDVLGDRIRKKSTKRIRNVSKTTEEDQKADSFDYYFINDFAIRLVDSSRTNDSLKILVFDEEDIVSPSSARDSVYTYKRNKFGSSSSYFLSFMPDHLVSQFDNSFLNSPYLTYTKGEALTPINKVTNAFVLIGINDLFKDYRIAGGVRIRGNLTGAEYLMAFENLKRRIDQKYIFYRKSESTSDQFLVNKIITNEGRIQLKFPFSRYSALKSDVFLRQDRNISLSKEQNSLEAADVVSTFSGLKFEYVFDNSRKIAENILYGSRLKLYVENYWNFESRTNAFVVVGGDIRKYVKLHKEIIWANRLAFASSMGSSKIVFMLGGIDNWLFPKINTDIQVDPEVNYIYKSLATQMRGFTQNIRNGNSYAVFNSEIRFPVFSYFSSLPMKSSFLENFMIVTFADVGTAWKGLNPYSEDNSLNKRIINNNPLKISVITVGEPIVGGYGLGIRSKLFGYYIKLDHAWGFESGITYQQMTYISLGVDF